MSFFQIPTELDGTGSRGLNGDGDTEAALPKAIEFDDFSRASNDLM